MKRISNISYLSRAFMTLFVMGAVSGCVNDDFATDGFEQTTIKDGLAVSPFVSESQEKHAYTRADEGTTESDENLEEKTLNTLDVFVQHITDGTTPDATIMKAYHLPLVPNKPYADQAEHFLAENWRTEGLVEGQYYNIYVAANSTQTQSIEDGENVSVLTGLVYDENEGNAIFDPTKKEFEWKEDQPCGDIYKLYTSGSIEYQDGGETYKYRALTNNKEFMMDGVLKNWTPESGKKKQVFQPVIMNRAAAKIVMNLSFDTDFLKSLTHTKEIVKDKDGKDVETWVEKPAEEQVTITGTPAWRFFNFAFGAPVFAPEGNDWTGVSVLSSDFQIREKEGYSGNNMQHSIITYSYPNKWNDVSGAPSMIVSIGYTQNGNTSYNYYRIPIVPKATKTLDRNHIYVVNATIATRGSESHEDITEMENLVYEVLPWNDETNSAAIHNEVEPVQHYYLKVNPKVYTLRGDGDQSVPLTYLKASGTKVNWKLFTYDAEGNQTGVVAKDATGATRAWFYNANGDFTTTYNDNESGMDWSNDGKTPMGVTITQSTEGTSGSSGTVTVTSHALNNRAIKYIRLRVYLDEEATFKDGVETLYEDIIIRHFPTDNIQNIVGSWSSYHAAGSGTQEVTLKTRVESEAQTWSKQYGVQYTTHEVSATDYISYAEYTSHAGQDGYTRTETTSNYNTFNQAVLTNENRQAANSEENAVADAGEGLTYHWGTTPQRVFGETEYQPNTVAYYYDFDYYTSRQQGWSTYYTYYKYNNYYTATYTHTYTVTEYHLTVKIVSTGNWFDIADLNQTYTGNDRKVNGNSYFFAKVFNDGVVNAVVVNYDGNAKKYSLKHGNNYDYYCYWDGYQTSYMNTYFNHTNNHMYVIQISSTSSDYIMGRPVLGNPNANLSQDDVVSPAFMIASQLGAVTAFDDANDAATHCSRYMEVAADGTRYTGWRLPTEDEIRVITRYQQGTINGVTISNVDYQAMTPVLTGRYYWSLTGNKVDTRIGNNRGPFLRCVRDLSAAEVEHINGFDAIVEKYQKKANGN